jgi:hypothetical protein
MELDTILGYVMIFIHFAPIILFFVSVIVAFPLGIWAVIDLDNLQKFEVTSNAVLKSGVYLCPRNNFTIFTNSPEMLPNM